MRKQEIILTELYHNGTYPSFKEQELCVHIEIVSSNPETDPSVKRSIVYAPIRANENGEVDLTGFINEFLKQRQENPGKDVRAFATGFLQRMHFNSMLLQTPMPKFIHDMFGSGEK